MNNKIIILYIVAILDSTGIATIFPILRDYTIQLLQNGGVGVSYYPFFMGLLLASYSLFSLFFTPVLGHFSDIVGRKKVLLFSIVGNLLGYVIWYFSNSYLLFLISRIVAGSTGSVLSILSASVSINASGDDRLKSIGILNAFFGLGFLLGPLLSVVLISIDVDYQSISMLPIGLSLISILLTVCFFNEKSRSNSIEINISIGKIFKDLFQQKDTLKEKLIFYKISYFFVYFLLVHVETLIPWILLDKYNLDARETGYFLIYTGLISIISHALIHKSFIQKIKESQILAVGFLFLSVFCMNILLSDLAKSFWFFSLNMFFFGIGFSLINPLIVSLVSNITNKRRPGFHLGVLYSYSGLARVLSPIAVTIIYSLDSSEYLYFILIFTCLAFAYFSKSKK